MPVLRFTNVVTEEDWSAYQALREEIVYDRPMSVKDLRELYDNLTEDKPKCRVIGFRAEEPVIGGGAHYDPWVEESDVVIIYPFAKPDATREEIGEFLDYLLTWSKGQGAKAITSWIRDSWPAVRAVHEERGFEFQQQDPESALDLDAYDPGEFEPCIQRVVDSGCRIITYEDLRRERPDTFVEDVWDLEKEIVADIPMLVPAPAIPLEEFRRDLKTFEKHFGTSFVAVRGEELLGVSQVEIYHSSPTNSTNGLTGTRRHARRQGIALGLKAHALKVIKEMGVKTLMTANEESNPMFNINVKLGFRVVYQNLGMILRIR